MEKTFKHKTNGTIATYKDGVFKQGNCCVEIGCEPSSEFWEEALFITTDEVPIFKNNTYFVPQRRGSKYTSVLELPAERRSDKDLSRTFSTLEKATEFIEEHNGYIETMFRNYQLSAAENEKKYSLNDIKEALNYYRPRTPIGCFYIGDFLNRIQNGK